MAQPIRVALVGTGNIAGAHARALATLGGEASLVAAADIDAGQLARFCTEFGVERGYASLAELLDGAGPDLVHICTPPLLHREQAVACLRAGASVLVEKPPALSLRDLAEMAAAQGPAGPWLATVFQHRFGSGAYRLREMLHNGVLGRPLLAQCNTTWFRSQSYFDVEWRGKWSTEGGGPTMGHGIHQMDLLTAVLGDWVSVRAIARQQARRTQTEDVSLAHVVFANGAVASIVNSVVSPREETYLRFDFEYATVELTHLYGYRDDDWRVTPAPGHEESIRAALASAGYGVDSGHHAQFAEVMRSLRAGTAPPVTAADATRTMRLVAGVYASAFHDRAIGPDDLGPGSPFHDRMDGDGARWPEQPGQRG